MPGFDSGQCLAPSVRAPSQMDRGSLPQSFPRCITSDMVWSGATYQDDPDRYRINLNDAQIKEIEAACRYFKSMFKYRKHVLQ